MSRRGLLTASLAVVAAPGLVQAKAGFPWPLGVQLWSVDAELARDFDGTLVRLAALGFVSVESAGLHGRSPEAFRQALAAAGLRCDSAHAAMDQLRAKPAEMIGAARDSGARWLVCSSPSPSRPLAAGLDWIQAMARAMTWTTGSATPTTSTPWASRPPRRGWAWATTTIPSSSGSMTACGPTTCCWRGPIPSG